MAENYCSQCGSSLTQKKIEDKNRFYCENCSTVVWQNPKPVAWLLVKKDNEYLLVKRANDPDKGEWDIPGGFLELEESFAQAAIRELEEETSLKIREDEIELFDTIAFNRGESYVVGAIFYTEIDRALSVKAGDDASEAEFWNLKELRNGDKTLRSVCDRLLE